MRTKITFLLAFCCLFAPQAVSADIVWEVADGYSGGGQEYEAWLQITTDTPAEMVPFYFANLGTQNVTAFEWSGTGEGFQAGQHFGYTWDRAVSTTSGGNATIHSPDDIDGDGFGNLSVAFANLPTNVLNEFLGEIDGHDGNEPFEWQMNFFATVANGNLAITNGSEYGELTYTNYDWQTNEGGMFLIGHVAGVPEPASAAVLLLLGGCIVTKRRRR